MNKYRIFTRDDYLSIPENIDEGTSSFVLKEFSCNNFGEAFEVLRKYVNSDGLRALEIAKSLWPELAVKGRYRRVYYLRSSDISEINLTHSKEISIPYSLSCPTAKRCLV